MGLFDKENIKEMGQLPDFNIGRIWLVENYENFHTRYATAYDYWARNVKNVYEINMRLWVQMNRCLDLIRYRKPIITMPEYEEIVKRWDYMVNNAMVPKKDVLIEFSRFLNKALYELKIVYDEEVEKEYEPADYRGRK